MIENISKREINPRKKVILSRVFSLCNILAFIFFAIALVFDLVSKDYAVKLLTIGQEVDFLPGFLSFKLVQNYGGAGGFFKEIPILLIIVTFIFLIVFMWLFCTKRSNSALLGIGSGLLVGGCIGNLVQRLFLGKVWDFLNFQFITFPTFNVADCCITLAIILIFIYFAFIYPKELKKFNARLVQENESVDKNGKVYTDDLDGIDTHNFDLRGALRGNKMVAKKQKKQAKSQKKLEKK